METTSTLEVVLFTQTYWGLYTKNQAPLVPIQIQAETQKLIS